MPDGPSNILIVENNYHETRLILESLKETGYKYSTHTVHYGRDALFLLNQEEKHPETRYIDLILLDLGLNDIDGFEILKKVKSSPTLETIPVVILTSSNNPKDIDFAHKYGADKYIIKPCDFKECVKALKEVMAFCNFKLK